MSALRIAPHEEMYVPSLSSSTTAFGFRRCTSSYRHSCPPFSQLLHGLSPVHFLVVRFGIMILHHLQLPRPDDQPKTQVTIDSMTYRQITQAPPLARVILGFLLSMQSFTSRDEPLESLLPSFSSSSVISSPTPSGSNSSSPSLEPGVALG
jgi:hypothetical protein